MEDAPVLRTRLATLDPAMSASLEEATRIARNEWLPALPTQYGSSNAYPHLRNVAGYLEHIVLAFEGAPETGFVPLSAGETYIALLAVLFHDYGRLDSASGVKHGTVSWQQLVKHHAELGVHSREIADLVGRIAECHEYHAPGQPKRRAAAIAQLADTLIDPVGAIRAPLLAALLALADQMDAAYTRSVPEYLTDAKGGVVGLFRRHIRGVCVDPKTRLVKMVMTFKGTDAEDAPDGEESATPLYAVRLGDNVGKAKLPDEFLDEKKLVVVPPGMTPADMGELLLKRLGNEIPSTQHWWEVCKVEDQPLIKLLAWDKVRLERQMKPQDRSQSTPSTLYIVAMPRFGPHAIAFGNMQDNHAMLEEVAPFLGRYGICLDSWLVQIDGRLFRHDGRETFEPILSRKLLEDAGGAMWALATSVFGATSFGYEDVAAHLGDPSVWRVKVACQRFAALVSTMADADSLGPPPWAGAERWHWHAHVLRSDGGNGSVKTTSQCRYISLDRAIASMELGDPHE